MIWKIGTVKRTTVKSRATRAKEKRGGLKKLQRKTEEITTDNEREPSALTSWSGLKKICLIAIRSDSIVAYTRRSNAVDDETNKIPAERMTSTTKEDPGENQFDG